jgi:hypothetical protein
MESQGFMVYYKMRWGIVDGSLKHFRNEAGALRYLHHLLQDWVGEDFPTKSTPEEVSRLRENLVSQEINLARQPRDEGWVFEPIKFEY